MLRCSEAPIYHLTVKSDEETAVFAHPKFSSSGPACVGIVKLGRTGWAIPLLLDGVRDQANVEKFLAPLRVRPIQRSARLVT
jgi:hypothetical protein